MEENSTLNDVSLLEDLNAETANLLLPVITILSVLSIVGAIGNSLVLYIWSRKLEKSTSNFCVLFLAVLDLVLCTFGIPMAIYKLSNQFYFDNPAVCKMFRFLVDFSVYASITVLLFIACIRYYAVCKPTNLFPLESRRILLMSVCAGLCLAWPVLILHGTAIKTSKYTGINGVDCGIDQSFANSTFPNIYFSVLGLVFVICLMLLSGLYGSIAVTIYRRSRRKSCYIDSQTKHEVKLNKLFFAITLVFVLSFLPSLAVMAIKASNPRIETKISDHVYVLYIFCFKSYLINSCVNPILYGFMNRHFKIECKKIFSSFRGIFLKS